MLLVSRPVVVLLGIWAPYQAMYTPSVLKQTLYAYIEYAAALTPVILAAFYSKRANAAGAVTAIALGRLSPSSGTRIHPPPSAGNHPILGYSSHPASHSGRS